MEQNPEMEKIQFNPDDFAPATAGEKESLVIMRESVNFWADGFRRLRKNKIAMVSLFFILLIVFFAYILPSFWPYTYDQQIKYSENLSFFEYGKTELQRIEAGESVFPHICGTDKLGRDFAVRLMMATRISLTVGIMCSMLVLLVGATYGAVAGFAGGLIDDLMMRFTDILYTIPDILLIILLSIVLKPRIIDLAENPGFEWMQKVGPSLIAMFIVFALLYWVGMARITRSQVLVLKESEYVTAARALGAGSGRIIRKHLLTNCIGTLIVTTTLQIPAAIFTESYLSFLGLGVSAPMPSLGSLANAARGGIQNYPHKLVFPAMLICLIVLALNLLGDGLRDAFDPKLRR